MTGAGVETLQVRRVATAYGPSRAKFLAWEFFGRNSDFTAKTPAVAQPQHVSATHA